MSPYDSDFLLTKLDHKGCVIRKIVPHYNEQGVAFAWRVEYWPKIWTGSVEPPHRWELGDSLPDALHTVLRNYEKEK